MADNDAEIRIAFTAEAEDAEGQFGRMNELVGQLADKVKGTVRALEAVGEEAVSAAQAVQIMQERAGRTGKAEVMQAVDQAFLGGAGKAAELDVRYGKLERALGILGERIADVSRRFQAGDIAFGQAEAVIRKLEAQAGKAQGAVSSFAGSVQDALGDLVRAEGLDNMLASYNQVAGQMEELGRHARDLKGDLSATVQGLADQKNALDSTSPGFEQQSMKLAQAMQGYDGYIHKLNDLIAKMAQVDAKASGAVQEAVNGNGDRAQAERGLKQAQEELAKWGEALESVGNRVALADQKRAASAEAAAEKASAAHQKEAAAAQAAAEAEEKRSAREAYAMKLSAMGRQQLVAEIGKLSQARLEAAKAGDVESYGRLAEQLGQGRQAMRRLNADLNLSKVKWMQQAQTAQMLGGQIAAMCNSVAHLGDAAKAGELDMVGFATGIMTLSYSAKAALGPLGWVLAAVQALQMAVNAYIKSQNEQREAMRQAAKAARENAEAHRQGAKALEDYNAQQELEAKQQQLVGYYKRLNKELDERKRKISEITQAELRNRALKEDAEDHGLTMRQLQLEQELTNGMVTQAQYQREMLELEKKRANIAAGRAVAAAQNRYDDLLMQQQLNAEAIRDKTDMANQVYNRGRGMDGEELFSMAPEQVHLVYGNFINKYLRKLADARVAGNGEQAEYFESLVRSLKSQYLAGEARYSDEGEYAAKYKAQKAQEELAMAELRAAREEGERLAQEKAKAGAELSAAEARAAQEEAQADALHRQKIANLQAKEEAEARQKRRQEQLEQLGRQVASLEENELEPRKQAALKKSRQAGNALTSQYYGQRASVYRQEQERRAGIRQEYQQQGYSGQTLNNLMWFATRGEELQRKSAVNDKGILEVLQKVYDALETNSKADDEMAAKMLSGLNLSADLARKNAQKVQAATRRLEASIRAMQRNNI